MNTRTNIKLIVARVLAGSIAGTLAVTAGCGGIADNSLSSSSGGSSSGGSSSGGSSSGGSSSGGSSSGGSSSGGSSSGGTNGWLGICLNRTVALLPGFRPARPAQYIEIRTESAYPSGTAGLQFNQYTVEKTGRPCDLSPQGSACYSQFTQVRLLPTDAKSCQDGQYGTGTTVGGDAAPSPKQPPPPEPGAGIYGGCNVEYLLYTVGGTVGVAQTLPEIRAFLGSIDSPQEAFYLARNSGYRISCDDGPVPEWRAARGGGYELRVQKRFGTCQDGIIEATVVVSSDGNLTKLSEKVVRAEQPCAIGRRPEGLCDLDAATQLRSAALEGDCVGEFFAEAAKLEAASVHAFARMHSELARLGADAHLLERVESARQDEIRHARSTSALARRFGSAPKRAVIAPERARSVLDIAVENAVEGCVRETYGAVVAAYQARMAQDAEIVCALQQIAVDEAAHAQLSWDVAAFLDAQLSVAERAAVAHAQTAAEAELLAELSAPQAPRLMQLAGVPTAAVAQALLVATLTELRAA
jgi:hypothetical protein